LKDAVKKPVTKAVLGVDIGGTKIAISVLEVDEKGNLLDVLSTKQYPALPLIGKPEKFYRGLFGVIKEVKGQAESDGIEVLPFVGIGSPGRFVKKGDKKVIAPESASNLGFGEEEVYAEKIIADILGENDQLRGFNIYMNNDAIAQMAYGLESLLKGEYRALLSGKKAAYIGPGTGLGGGFCEISEDGEIEFITDGQIFDLVLGPEFEFKFRHDGRDMRIDMKGTAEDIFSGRAIKEMMQKIDAEIGGRGIFSTLAARLAAESKEDYEKVMGGFLLSYIIEDRIKAPDEVKAIAEKMALFFGAGQAQIISSIYEGNINKRRADAQWNEDDKKAVRGIVNYVLGGSIATKGKLGRDLVAETNRILTATYPETKFNLIPIDITSEDAGVLGAASFIVKEEAAKYIRSVSKPGLVSVIGTRIFEGSVWGMAVLPALNLASEAVKPVLDLAGIGERYGYLKVKGGSKTILETTIEKIQAAGDTGLDGNIESVRTEEEKLFVAYSDKEVEIKILNKSVKEGDLDQFDLRFEKDAILLHGAALKGLSIEALAGLIVHELREMELLARGQPRKAAHAQAEITERAFLKTLSNNSDLLDQEIRKVYYRSRIKGTKIREAACVVYLMDLMHARIGGDSKGGAVGLTTLKTRNIKLLGDNMISWDFMGKSNVPWKGKAEVSPEVYSLLEKLVSGKKRNDRIFKASDKDVRNYLKQFGEFDPKNYRTYYAAEYFREEFEKARPKRAAKTSLGNALSQAYLKAGLRLGHKRHDIETGRWSATGSTAKANYVDPKIPALYMAEYGMDLRTPGEKADVFPVVNIIVEISVLLGVQRNQVLGASIKAARMEDYDLALQQLTKAVAGMIVTLQTGSKSKTNKALAEALNTKLKEIEKLPELPRAPPYYKNLTVRELPPVPVYEPYGGLSITVSGNEISLTPHLEDMALAFVRYLYPSKGKIPGGNFRSNFLSDFSEAIKNETGTEVSPDALADVDSVFASVKVFSDGLKAVKESFAVLKKERKGWKSDRSSMIRELLKRHPGMERAAELLVISEMLDDEIAKLKRKYGDEWTENNKALAELNKAFPDERWQRRIDNKVRATRAAYVEVDGKLIPAGLRIEGEGIYYAHSEKHPDHGKWKRLPETVYINADNLPELPEDWNSAGIKIKQYQDPAQHTVFSYNEPITGS
ncbi:MAG TPA: hypothetical protein VJC03_03905, partial [bacterium]|nr:hypothetical protein [bacterium]